MADDNTSTNYSNEIQVALALTSLMDEYFSDKMDKAIRCLVRKGSPDETLEEKAKCWAINMAALQCGARKVSPTISMNGILVDKMDVEDVSEMNQARRTWSSFYQKLAVFWECGGDFFRKQLKSHEFPGVNRMNTFLKICEAFDKANFLYVIPGSTEGAWQLARPVVYSKIKAIVDQLST